MILFLGAGSQEVVVYLQTLHVKLAETVGGVNMRVSTTGDDALGFAAGITPQTAITMYYDNHITDLTNLRHYREWFLRKLPFIKIIIITDLDDVNRWCFENNFNSWRIAKDPVVAPPVLPLLEVDYDEPDEEEDDDY